MARQSSQQPVSRSAVHVADSAYWSHRWFRRELHLKHHIISGQVDDAEERLIGLGLPWSWRRLVATVHPFGVLLLSSEVAKDATWLDVQRMNLTSAPVAFIFFGLNKALLAYLIAFFMFGESAGPLPLVYWPWVRDLNILICLPNILRSFSIIALSTCSHYYGDIPGKSVFFQNQILDHWILYPFQIFAFNFGKCNVFVFFNSVFLTRHNKVPLTSCITMCRGSHFTYGS